MRSDFSIKNLLSMESGSTDLVPFPFKKYDILISIYESMRNIMKVSKTLILAITVSCFSFSCTNINLADMNQQKQTTITKIDDFSSFGVSSNSLIKVNPFTIQHNSKKIRLNKSPELIISDIKLADTNQSIMSENSTEPPAFISSKLSGKDIEIVVTGTFKALRKLKLSQTTFTLEPPMIHQSFAYNDNDPKVRLLLNDACLFTITSISETEIRATLNTRSILDLYLLGKSHKVTLVAFDYFTDTLIKVDEPEETDVKLFPQIDNVEVIKDNKNIPQFVKLTGKNFMLNPKFSYSTIDKKFVLGYLTNILALDESDKHEALIHIPEPKKFNLSIKHTLIYSTPFGTAFKEF